MPGRCRPASRAPGARCGEAGVPRCGTRRAYDGKNQHAIPGCPPEEARGIAAHTAARGSGRVGRSAAGRALDDHALSLAVAAWVRHRHTRYDELLMNGWERADARGKIREELDEVLDHWGMLAAEE